MRAIAIVELPDDAFDKGRWYLDKFVYTEKESLFDDYANDMWELKPLPSKKIPVFDPNSTSYDEEYEKRIMYEIDGWNACLDEITGEQNDRS